jgi:hypothetical protein
MFSRLILCLNFPLTLDLSYVLTFFLKFKLYSTNLAIILTVLTFFLLSVNIFLPQNLTLIFINENSCFLKLIIKFSATSQVLAG